MSGQHQHLPWYLRAANSLGGVVTSMGAARPSLNPKTLQEEACKKTGLDNFGPQDFLPPLEVLTESYEQEANLNFVGRLSAHTYLLRLLENRLLLERDRQQHKEIPQQQIEAPVFILGLPRTGSTLLFELLAQNRNFRSPMSWEVMLPSPPPRAETFTNDPRIAATQRLLDWVDRLAPDFKRIHKVGATLPQECIAMQAQAFRSIQFHTTNNVPTYQSWLNHADMVPAYAYHKRMLQHFQAFGPPGRWLLKAPGHLFGIDALFQIYPDARIVQTHRDPLKVVASIASHCACLRRAFTERINLEEIGRTWANLWAEGLSQTLAFRRAHPELEKRFLDVHYADVIEDPLAVAERIHSHCGVRLSEEAKAAMADYLKVHPKGKHGAHRYQLKDYGLDAGHERDRFKDYSTAFAIELSMTG